MSDSQSVNVADPVVLAMITFCLRLPPLTITGVSRWLKALPVLCPYYQSFQNLDIVFGGG